MLYADRTTLLMAKLYPALDVRAANPDLLLAALDDFSPSAIEERDGSLRAYFGDSAARDVALHALASRFDAAPIDVSDDDWAIRSQQNLAPITVGRITIVPNPQPPIANPYTVTIVPSMGFGTGHHATTRLCLAAMQEAVGIDPKGKIVLDAGTGSGLLAIAADRLGAARAIGIDVDPDAIRSAEENLSHNPGAHAVSFQLADLLSTPLPPADLVVANLTGALLVRSAPRLLAATTAGGCVIASGFLTSERDEVRRAFEPAEILWERSEDEWGAIALKKP